MRNAFTVIELLIAVALSAIIAATAFTAFRVAVQASTTANRLSAENAMLRAGMQEAHRSLDYWTDCDDPFDAARQTLRAPGLPFAPLPASTGVGEAARGWDATDRWSVHEPRTWYHGNIGEHSEARAYEQTFGRYGAFANTEPSPAFSTTPQGKGYGLVEPVRHTWLYNQMEMVLGRLGYYGFCEYMPANAIFATYRPFDPATTSYGGIPIELVRPGSAFINADGAVSYARGLFLLTFGSSYAVPRTSGRWGDAGAMLAATHRLYQTSYMSASTGTAGTSDSVDYTNLLAETENRAAVLDLAPAHWPDVSVRTQRLVKDARFGALARVRWASPLTGGQGEINLTGFSTSLRGARQQRAPAGGWAAVDAVGAPAGATLDTP